jgi:signal transduction histidine kinase
MEPDAARLVAAADDPASVRRGCVAIAAIAVVLQVLMLALPRESAALPPGTSLMAAHLLLELFAVIISFLVVAVAWHTQEFRAAPRGGVFVWGFFVVGACDLVHALCYRGMPDFFGAGDVERAIFFWLMSRTAEVGTLAAVALNWRPTLRRGQALLLGVVTCVLLFELGFPGLAWFPRTFLAGTGVTAFKRGYELALFLANIGIGAVLWRQGRRANDIRRLLLGTSAFVIGVGELSFTEYRDPGELQNVFGHFYKIAGYALLFVAAVRSGLREPLQALRSYQSQLAELTRRLMDQERISARRMAQMLHDQLGQTLTAIRIDYVTEARFSEPALAARQERVNRLVDQAVREVRAALVELRPTVLDEQGLVEALDSELRERRAGAGAVEFELEVDDALALQRWDADVEYAVFMIAKEAIGNAVQHAGAGLVRVALAGGPRSLSLRVEDDGRGFAANERRAEPGHLGLIGMRERAVAIGARLDIESTAGGTTLQVRWEGGP